jgi:hypothetical protein
MNQSTLAHLLTSSSVLADPEKDYDETYSLIFSTLGKLESLGIIGPFKKEEINLSLYLPSLDLL